MTAVRDLERVDVVSLRCRRALAPFYESVGFQLADAEVDVPEGGTDETVRVTFERNE